MSRRKTLDPYAADRTKHSNCDELVLAFSPRDRGVDTDERDHQSDWQFLQQGIAAIFRFFELIWNWSFGQMVAIFQSDWQSLPIWKIVVLAAVVIAIVYVLYKAVIQLWKAAEQILKAFIGLLERAGDGSAFHPHRGPDRSRRRVGDPERQLLDEAMRLREPGAAGFLPLRNFARLPSVER